MRDKPVTTPKWPYVVAIILAFFALFNFMKWAIDYTIDTHQDTLFVNLDVLAVLIFFGVIIFCLRGLSHD